MHEPDLSTCPLPSPGSRDAAWSSTRYCIVCIRERAGGCIAVGGRRQQVSTCLHRAAEVDVHQEAQDSGVEASHTETKVVSETSAAAMAKMNASIPNTWMHQWLENRPLMQVASRWPPAQP